MCHSHYTSFEPIVSQEPLSYCHYFVSKRRKCTQEVSDSTFLPLLHEFVKTDTSHDLLCEIENRELTDGDSVREWVCGLIRCRLISSEFFVQRQGQRCVLGPFLLPYLEFTAHAVSVQTCQAELTHHSTHSSLLLSFLSIPLCSFVILQGNPDCRLQRYYLLAWSPSLISSNLSCSNTLTQTEEELFTVIWNCVCKYCKMLGINIRNEFAKNVKMHISFAFFPQCFRFGVCHQKQTWYLTNNDPVCPTNCYTEKHAMSPSFCTCRPTTVHSTCLTKGKSMRNVALTFTFCFLQVWLELTTSVSCAGHTIILWW